LLVLLKRETSVGSSSEASVIMLAVDGRTSHQQQLPVKSAVNILLTVMYN
jgi:hypothetical protein